MVLTIFADVNLFKTLNNNCTFSIIETTLLKPHKISKFLMNKEMYFRRSLKCGAGVPD